MTNSLTVRQMLQLLDSGKVSAVELCRDTLKAIHARQDLNAFITVNDDEAAAQAQAADEARAGGRAGALCGVPIALKDILLTRGCPTTAASKMLANFIPPFDGTVVARLREAGAVFVGKNNCDAFAMGSSNENSAFGPVHNPRAPGCIPGGSSGGSAAAVAADLCGAAIGTDTGGSIRQPAAMCGIVGLKPTYGRVSRYGVVAFASSLDQVGPMGKSVWDVAKLLSLIAGHDERDSTSSAAPMSDYTAAAQRGPAALKGLKVGVPREYFVGGLEPAVERAVRATLQKMERAGAHLIEIGLPHTEYAIATFYIICTAEASSNLARYDGMRFGHRSEGADLEETYRKSRSEGFGAENQRRIMLGTYVLSAGYYEAYYLHAQKVRTLIRQDFAKAFEQVDVIATPTSPTTAFPLGSRVNDPLAMYLADVFNVPCNLAGLPGISVPCGEDEQKKPIGLQLLGKWFDEATLLATAGAVEVLLDGEEAR